MTRLTQTDGNMPGQGAPAGKNERATSRQGAGHRAWALLGARRGTAILLVLALGLLIGCAGSGSHTGVRTGNRLDSRFCLEDPAHTNIVNAVVLSPDGELLLSASSDGTIRLWSVVDNRLLETRDADDSRYGVRDAALSPDGKTLYTAGADGKIRQWTFPALVEQKIIAAHDEHILTLDISPDGALLASAGADRDIRLWSLPDMKRVGQLWGHVQLINDVAFSPDGKILASAGADRTVRLWSVDEKKEIGSIDRHTGFANAVAFSPDGKYLATGAGSTMSELDTQYIGIWNMPDLTEHAWFEVASRYVVDLVFTPDSSTLITANGGGAIEGDGLVVTYRVSDGDELETLKGHKNAARCLAVSADDKILVSGGADKVIKVWTLPTGEPDWCLFDPVAHPREGL